ncbi:MAG: fumarylacetoacetate hydrolase family protein [Anaerolineae bacterium]|nr:fumarylacetoacetate hydrolase family protein [Anaerolineae bacterium]
MEMVSLADLSPQLPSTLDDLLPILDIEIISRLYEATRTSAPKRPLQDVRLLPPIMYPGKILCVGLNYKDHVLEGGRELPQHPTIFSKTTSSLTGHKTEILLPACSQMVDYEAELAVVIGKRGKHIPRKAALSYVAGYTILNDVTARDYQKRSTQWTVGKSFDTFAPMGPFLVTADEIPNPHCLEIAAHLNGTQMQHSNTTQLIFDIPYLIEDISAGITLEPGDIIATGTPSGVGVYRQPPVFLQDGDIIEITIESLGILQNTCRREPA